MQWIEASLAAIIASTMPLLVALAGWALFGERLRPLEDQIVVNIKDWLPKLAYPIRLGTHNQSAFAFGLMIDYARIVGDAELERMLVDASLAFHRDDVDCPLAYEPSGEDFLSPCLMEADLMRRVMPADEFGAWLQAFMPQIPVDGSGDWLAPGVVIDPTDGKLVHLDGMINNMDWAVGVHPTTHMRETCVTADGGRITNDYWVDTRAGLVWQSQQWAGPHVGYVKMRRLTTG